MSEDKALTPSYKLQKRNSKRVDLTRQQFQAVTTELTAVMMSVSTFDATDRTDYSTDHLRKMTGAAYRVLAPFGALAFDRPMDWQLMFGLSIDGFDVVNGVVVASFVYEESRVQTRYQLQIYAPLAPFTEEWPRLLASNGGDAKPFLNRMALV